MANNNSEFLQRLKEHLRKLFQLDFGELDFGIYRIMNYKRKEIENFIEKDLIETVEKEFEQYKTQSNQELLSKIEEKEKKIKEDFGSDILKNGKLIEEYGKTKLVKEYLELKSQLDQIKTTENIQNQVFNDLYDFFSRYYEDGDFISKRRISSKQHKYAIPYNGEEVKLHWANFDQYYIKTGEVFKDYEFNLKNWRVIFRTTLADVETGNTKGENRYFILGADEPVRVDKGKKTCIIQFEYRPLTEDDFKHYKVETKSGKEKKTGIKQNDLNPILSEKILKRVTDLEIKSILLERQPSDEEEKSNEKTILEKHLYKYTRKITSDFFIHKNLKVFLERELDYFIKSEIIDLNNLEPRHITRAKVVEGIAKRIIEFLAQIEDFQKLLWEKKKFILKTEYVITTDRVPEEFYDEILKNKEQKKEWAELISTQNEVTRQSLKKLHLPIDTKHFNPEFKERLLEKLTSPSVIARSEATKQSNGIGLDDLIDGVLIKSENWQALNLILEKYNEKVQTIFIDPPFNLGTNPGFLYKVDYKDSSWICILENRLQLAKNTLNDKGSIFVRCDYNGNMYVRMLMNEVFGEGNFRNEVIISRTRAKQQVENQFVQQTENLFFYSRGENLLLKEVERPRNPKWHSLLHFPRADETPRIVLDKEFYPPKGRRWALSQERISKFEKEGKIRINKDLSYGDCKGKSIKGVPELLYDTEIVGNEWIDIPGYSQAQHFSTENSEILLKRVIESASNECDLVMDFFLGSGTTTAVAHKLKRKWIGIEMGEHFETVVLPRMKKVLFYDKSGISKEVKDYKGGGFFKYHSLEQYEDTLHNIEFLQEEKGRQAEELFGKSDKGNEYLMKYFLRYETEGSPSILNLKQFENPFDYKLKIISGTNAEEIIKVDLVETFNYLVGLKVNKYKFIKDNSRKYAFVFGERNHRRVAIVWRETKDIDLEKDKKIIEITISDYNPDEVFINGDAFYPKGYKVIESEFKALMRV